VLVRSILMACVATFGFVSASRASADDVAKIKALEQHLASAITSRNVDAIMQSYIPDESLFVFDVIPPRQYVGAKAFREDWGDFLAGLKGPLKYEVTDVVVTTVGDLGYGHSIQRVVATNTKGQPVDLTTRVTDVYRKLKGRWVIVQEHISVPVDLDTGKPDLTSKP
jgi:ketosteroid isomerase-like protein